MDAATAVKAPPPESFFVFVVGHCEEWPENRKEQGDIAIYQEYLDFGVPEDQCLYIQNNDCTKSNCQAQLEKFLKTHSKDENDDSGKPRRTLDATLVFHYGGHGSAYGFNTIGGTWPYESVGNTIESYFHGNRVLCLLDCCAAGNIWKQLFSSRECVLLATSQPYITASSEGDEWILTSSWIQLMRNKPMISTRSDEVYTDWSMDTLISCLADRHVAGLGDLFFAYWKGTKNPSVSWMPSNENWKRTHGDRSRLPKVATTNDSDGNDKQLINQIEDGEHNMTSSIPSLPPTWLPSYNGRMQLEETLPEMPRGARILSAYDCRIGDAIGYKHPGGNPFEKPNSDKQLSFYVPPLWLHGRILSILESDLPERDILFRIKVWYPSQENHPWEVEVSSKSRRLVNQFWIAQTWMLPRGFERTQIMLAQSYGQYLDLSITPETQVQFQQTNHDASSVTREGRVLDWKDFRWKQLYNLHRTLLSADGTPVFPGKTKYDEYYWDELPVPVRTAAIALGYSKAHWDDDIEIPADGTEWKDLTTEQQEAASFLGYVRQVANNDPATPDCGSADESSESTDPERLPVNAGLVSAISTKPGPHVPVIWNDNQQMSFIPCDQIRPSSSGGLRANRTQQTRADEGTSEVPPQQQIQSLIHALEASGKRICDAASIFGTAELSAYWPEEERWYGAEPLPLDTQSTDPDITHKTLELLTTHFQYPFPGVYCPILFDDGDRCMVPVRHIFRRNGQPEVDDDDSESDDDSSVDTEEKPSGEAKTPSEEEQMAGSEMERATVLQDLTQRIENLLTKAKVLEASERASEIVSKLEEVSTLVQNSIRDVSSATQSVPTISDSDHTASGPTSPPSTTTSSTTRSTSPVQEALPPPEEIYLEDYWKDLPKHVRKAAKRLGYTRKLWDDDDGKIPIDDTDWSDLTLEQKQDLRVLGYTPESWATKDDSDSESDSESDSDDSDY